MISPDFVPGKFEYIQNINDRKMLSSAYDAITITETWDFIKNLYEFNNYPELNRIMHKIEELGYYGHSGISFIMVINSMKYIAIYGEKSFKENYQK